MISFTMIGKSFAPPTRPRAFSVAALAAAIFVAISFAAPTPAELLPQPAPKGTASPTESLELRQPLQELIVDGQAVGERVAAEAGEICLVCGRPIGKDDVVYLVNGHRVPLHAKICYTAFRRRPWKYLALISPHGAFLGSGGEVQGISLAWFFFGLYVLLGLVFAAVCAHRAVNTGQNPVGWFAVGLVLNAVGYLLLLTRPRGSADAPVGVPKGFQKVPLTYSPRVCSRCGTPNHPSAGTCAGCGAKLEAQVVSEVQKAAAHP